MMGVLELTERRGRKPQAERRWLLGLCCLWGDVPVKTGMGERRLCRRLERGCDLLLRSGVRRVLTAEDFPYWEELRRARLRPVEPETFCQAQAAPLALEALGWQERRPERASVLLYGRRVSPALFRAAEQLCPRVRDLAVDAGEEGEELAGWLRAEFGAAVRPPEAGQADVVLAFDPGAPAGRTVFHLYGHRPNLAGFLPALADCGLPSGLDRLPLLAVLWEEGKIKGEELRFLPPNTKLVT